MKSLFFAPVQGHTDAAYRHFHHKIYNPENLIYTTPFIRLEKNELRKKDIKDLTSPLNEGLNLIPQIIFRDEKELSRLISLIRELGYKKIDLNMGCPFPLQVSHGRGAAAVANEELAKSVKETINSNRDIDFSVKIRLGNKDADEWKILLPALNGSKLEYLTVHPRTASQQYGGELYADRFSQILTESKNPVVFNGDVKTPENAWNIEKEYNKIAGLMCGRGALCRPSIFNEIAEGKEWDRERRIDMMLRFHRELYDYYESVLQGDTQLLSKIQPFWEYAEDEIGRKAWKQIKKAVSIPKYNTALHLIHP